MSSVPAQPLPPGASSRNEITIISHSNFFYWWPVWAVGFLMAALTWFNGYVLVTVPAKASNSVPVAKENWVLEDGSTREGVLIEPIPHRKEKSDRALPRVADPNDPAKLVPDEPHLYVASNKAPGVVFIFVLLLVIVITNVPLRGMWSVLVILLVVLMIVIFALADLWKPILGLVGRLDVRMTMGGFILISTILFIIWLITFTFFDRQMYMTFTPGQLKVCTEIGGGEKVYDAIGMTLEKQRSDLFRHWILGLGSGDLIVKTSGAQSHHFDLPNVLFIGRKVAMIEEMLKKKTVIETK